jgi:AAA family ATP:ADP antiporter
MKDAPENDRPDGRPAPWSHLLPILDGLNAPALAQASLLALNFFLLFTAYFAVKPLRESLILAHPGGAELKSYAGGLQALLFVALVPAYSELSRRIAGRKLLVAVYLFLASNLVVFAWVSGTSAPWLGVVFFPWVGMFNVLSISSTWSLCNDLHSPDQGKRAFPLVAFGASSGAVFGSAVVSGLTKGKGPALAMGGAALLLVIGAVILWFVSPRSRDDGLGAPTSSESSFRRLGGGLSLVMRNRTLTLIAMLVLVINVVNTTSEYMLGRLVSENALSLVAKGQAGGATAAELIGAFYARFYFWVNTLVLVFQVFLVPWLVRRFRLSVPLMLAPILGLASYALIAIAPILPILRVLKIAENAVDYSVSNTAREMLYLGVSREEKYKAKSAIDTCFWRTGDAVSGLAVFGFSACLGLGISAFAVFNSALAIVWITVVSVIGRRLPQKQPQ